MLKNGFQKIENFVWFFLYYLYQLCMENIFEYNNLNNKFFTSTLYKLLIKI